MLRRAAAVHATTHAEMELFGDAIPARAARRVVGNGVATSQFATLPPRGSFRREIGIDADKPLLLFLGRLSRKKGLEILIRAVARMPTTDVALAIVGPDDEGLTADLRDLARRVDISQRTHFVGPRYGEQRLAALADADIWILPSHTENFGNAAIEAMAAGVPVVMSTEVNLAADVVRAGAGCVVPCDAAAVADACMRLLKDPGERRQLAAAGREYAAEYDWPRVAHQLAAMFKEFAR
jgi:glycosyltransferase involved in cell wall biosynthesis